MGADWRKTIVLFAQLGVSATILSVCSYVMISKQYPDDYVKWLALSSASSSAIGSNRNT